MSQYCGVICIFMMTFTIRLQTGLAIFQSRINHWDLNLCITYKYNTIIWIRLIINCVNSKIVLQEHSLQTVQKS